MVDFSWPMAIGVCVAVLALAWWSIKHRDDDSE